MIKPFQKEYPLTQGFGEHPDWYARFGITGHNGLDFGLPCETKLICPIEGQIIEVANDPTGYGLYVKIENSAEGVLLAHLSSINISVGQKVDSSQHLGWSGTTGNSTGCHLHFGYYRTPRNRQNGFNGYIDPSPYFTENVIIPLNSEMNDQTKIPKELLGEDQDLEIQQIRGLLLDGKRDNLDLANCRLENEQLKKELKECQSKPPEVHLTADLSQVSISDLLISAIKKIFK